MDYSATMQALSWASLLESDKSIKAPAVENFLWGCDVAAEVKAADMDVVKAVLFRCLRDYTKARGLTNRALQLLHDVQTLGAASGQGISEKDLSTYGAFIQDTFNNALQHPDIMSSLMQLLSLLVDFDSILAKFDKVDDTSWCLSDAIVSCMSRYPGVKAVQKAAAHLLKEVLRSLGSSNKSKTHNLSSLKCADGLMQPLLQNLAMHQEDAELLSSCCSVLWLLVHRASSSVIETHGDETVAVVLSVALKNSRNGAVLRPCLSILDAAAVGEHHVTSIASTERGLLLFVDALALAEDERLAELALRLLLRGVSSKYVLNFVFCDADSTRAFVANVRKELESRRSSLKGAALKKLVAEVTSKLSAMLPSEPSTADGAETTSPEKKSPSPVKRGKQADAPSPVKSSSSSSGSSSESAAAVDSKKYEELIFKLQIGGDLILKLKEEVRDLRAANERLAQESRTCTEERAALGSANLELVDMCRLSQEQAELAVARSSSLQALVAEARDRVLALLEENEELRRGGRAFEIRPLNTTTAHDLDTSVDFPLSPEPAACKLGGVVRAAQKSYDEGLRGLCEAAVGEALCEAAPEMPLREMSSQTVRLFCSARQIFLCRGQVKQSNVSVSSLRLFLRDIEVVDGKRCKQRDVDIILSQLGVQQCLSIFGFAYVMVLCARKSHPNLTHEALLLRLAADIRSFVDADAAPLQQAKSNQFDAADPLSPDESARVRRFFDAERQALGIIFHAYLPNVPRERSDALTAGSHFAVGIDCSGALAFCRDFDLVPAVVNTVELSQFFGAAITTSNPVSSQQEPVLSLQQFQALLLQLAVSCQCFRDQGAVTTGAQSAVRRLANLFFWLDNSAGKDVILQRHGNLGVLRFKNAVKVGDMTSEKRARADGVRRATELRERVGPSKNVVTLFKN